MELKQLNWREEQKVKYCIPLWLKDEQVRSAVKKVKGRIAPSYEKRDEPIGIACYGPSLNDTWEKLREFKYVMTCSGAHKFLIERGIIPTWHIDVDPRPHKVELIGKPHRDVEYLMSSTCSPKLFEHLDGYNVKLWHVFDSKEEGMRILPPGEWALTGGCGVGLRTFTISRFLGFRELHIFGMDGSEGKTGKHAAAHPNQPSEKFLVEYDGKEYFTTPAMLEAARTTWHELNQMPDVKAIFYGEGLVQAMAKNYIPEYVSSDRALIAFSKPELISQDLLKLNAELHEDNILYGIGGGRHAKTVEKLLEVIKGRSVLDYGCGKGQLAKALPFPIWEYDPAIAGKDEPPRLADLVVCTDVLEHVELDKLGFVLADIHRCAKKLVYFTINTASAKKCYKDGRNTHLIQQGIEWWEAKLSKFFKIGKVQSNCNGIEYLIVAEPKALEKINGVFLDTAKAA